MSSYTRFNLDKRVELQSMLNEGISLSACAKALNTTTSTISREIIKYRVSVGSFNSTYHNDCIHRKDCAHNDLCPGMSKLCIRKTCNHCRKLNCTVTCKDYVVDHCHNLDKPPYVCNHCPSKSRCPLEHFFYKAADADKSATILRSESRSGINLTEDELIEIDSMLSPRILMGQSIHHIFQSSPGQFTISEKQAYNLVNNNLITARAIDLPRTVKFKKRSKKSNTLKVDKQCRRNRTYQDYLFYMSEHSDSAVLQGDSVIGRVGGKCLFTATWVQWDLQLGFIRDHNNSASITEIIDDLFTALGDELFHKVIPDVWLLDNGSEFSNPTEIEKYGIHVFYCDPSAPYQKGVCENIHTMIRRIIPKGTSMDDMDQNFINLAFSHTNAVKRQKLNNHSPFDMFSSVFDENILTSHFHLTKIDSKDVLLKPDLWISYKENKKGNQ